MNPKVTKLMNQYQKDNQKEAIIILWEDFQPLVYTFMRKFYIHPNNREDTKQDAFLKLLECANNYDPSTGVPFESYYKINLHYQFLNRINKKTEALVIDHDWENGCCMTDLLESTMGNAPAKAEEREIILALIAALETLTNKQKQVITQFYLQEIPLTQIAKKMGCSYKVAFKHKDVALKKIRRQLRNL